ncbi:hypothetical protein MNBD_GAMMA21-1548 [hydrothermal vent metagenome]|uniref:Uncharacterized protein n=1 Tax=hydrothermal vent metagenome TaxID=652676 RepID=A0A3B0ZVM7_9ZZZZ
MKIVLSRYLLLLFALTFSLNTAFADMFDEEEDQNTTAKTVPEGTPLYTTINIWYERPTKIFPLFHRGAILPVGTKVTLGDMNSKAFKFKTESGAEYRIYSRKYYSMTGQEMSNLFFSKKNPMAKGGQFHKFSKMEQKQIKAGILKKGMSRKAAIMAYGYPPTHVNPDINADVWQLWKSRWDKIQVTFTKDKITNILD